MAIQRPVKEKNEPFEKQNYNNENTLILV